jgi:hypothetical protein
MIIRERISLMKQMAECESTVGKKNAKGPPFNIQDHSLPPLRKGTALLVFGDHGITEEGMHGGSQNEEINAGLWYVIINCVFIIMLLEGSTHQDRFCH